MSLMGRCSTWDLVIPLSAAIIAINLTASPTEAFTLLTIINQTYWLSSVQASVSSARAQCAAQHSDLALFDTNFEYTNVFQYIKKRHTSVSDLWIDLIANDTDNDGYYEHFWKSENVSAGRIWYTGEPNENCLTVGQPCCARIDFGLAGLRDMVCGSAYLFLCKPRQECRDGSHNCSQVCLERDLGFACSCVAGYRLLGDRASCQDVDECTDPGASSCGQVCINAAGSYICGCNRGFELTAGSNTSCEDVNECDLGTSMCSHICTNTNGSYQCGCFKGYGLSADRHNCTDIDECSPGRGHCAQICGNTLGSYTCSCLGGFTLEADNHTCEDINECDNSSLCDQNCSNTNGSYFCTCDSGYEIQSDGVSCMDVDECAANISNTCGRDRPCTNTDGGYFCGCPVGYQTAPSTTLCADVDECADGIHDCSQTCNNTAGGYQCGCTSGYHLLTDHRTCSDIDECADASQSQACSGVCINVDGSFKCSCNPGFRLDPNHNTSCIDIDECVENPRSCDRICVNIQGSYYCSCGERFTLDSDLVKCKESQGNNRCPCSCTSLTKDGSLLIDYRRNLLLRRTSLASYRYTKVTAYDSRVSSQAIGFGGVIFITLFLGVIIVPELGEFLVKLAIRFKKK